MIKIELHYCILIIIIALLHYGVIAFCREKYIYLTVVSTQKSRFLSFGGLVPRVKYILFVTTSDVKLLAHKMDTFC